MNNWFKNALNSYDIDIIGITKFSDITYLIKGKSERVILRLIEAEKKELIEEVASYKFPFLEEFVINKKGKYVSCYTNQYFYLTIYHQHHSANENYYNKEVAYYLSNLHHASAKYRHLESGYYDKWLVTFEEHLMNYQKNDLMLFNTLLHSLYPSPSLWTYVINETCGKLYIEHFQRIISLFKKECLNKSSQRITLNYLHFGNDCYDSVNKKLIGCHRMLYDSPVFELFMFIGEAYDESTLSCMKEYMNNFSLEKEEAIFLICILYNSIENVFDNDEYQNIYNIVLLSRRIEFIFAFEEILGIDFSTLN